MRLERFILNRMETHNIFQFHKGAIRTDNEDKPTTLMLEFQFHKGAIRTMTNIMVIFVLLISIP